MTTCSRIDYYPGYPYGYNSVEITVLRFMILPLVTIVGVQYRPLRIPLKQLCAIFKINKFLVS